MNMIGAPAWLFGNTQYPTFEPAIPRVQPGAPGAPREWIPGGRAAGRNPVDFDRDQLAFGTHVELEHTGDPRIAREIAMDHLIEDPMYYRKLAQVHLDGLGITRARWAAPPSGLGLTRARWTTGPHLARNEQLQGITDLFDSWWWRNRKWLVLGGVGLLGLGILGLAGTLLK